MIDHLLIKVNANRWRKLADTLQYTLLAYLFIGLVILETLSKENARVAVWYFAGIMIVLLVICFLVDMKAFKLEKQYFRENLKHIKEMANDRLK